MRRKAWVSFVVIDGSVVIIALVTSVFPWLGMYGWDYALPLLAPFLALAHVIVGLIAVWLKKTDVSRSTAHLAIGWSAAAVVAWTIMPQQINEQVWAAEEVVTKQRGCVQTQPDYYPAGALVHCYRPAQSDTVWESVWATNKPLRSGKWSLEVIEYRP